jgi:hypothetical protein
MNDAPATEVLTMFQIEEPGSKVTFDWGVIEVIASGDNPMRSWAKALMAARSLDFHAGFSCGLETAALTTELAARGVRRKATATAFRALAKTLRESAYDEHIEHGAGRGRVTGGAS